MWIQPQNITVTSWLGSVTHLSSSAVNTHQCSRNTLNIYTTLFSVNVKMKLMQQYIMGSLHSESVEQLQHTWFSFCGFSQTAESGGTQGVSANAHALFTRQSISQPDNFKKRVQCLLASVNLHTEHTHIQPNTPLDHPSTFTPNVWWVILKPKSAQQHQNTTLSKNTRNEAERFFSRMNEVGFGGKGVLTDLSF